MTSRRREESAFTDADRVQLERRGISLDEARDQIARLAAGPAPVRLLRACTIGDGILRPDPALQDRALEAHAETAGAGGISTFVPASGAATRMFQDLTGFLEARSAPPTPTQRELFERLDELPFAPRLRLALAEGGREMRDLLDRGEYRAVVEALLGEPGLGLASLPKGLIPFHHGPQGAVTPFEEHLLEAAAVASDRGGRFRMHATVGPEHRDRFAAWLEGARSRGLLPPGSRAEVTFSVQDPSTDTLALEENGLPARSGDGSLLFRPSGHGALLGNLARHTASAGTAGGLVLIKNIDNVAPAARRGPTIHWSRVLLGMAVLLRRRIHELLDRLESGDEASLAEAGRFLETELGEPAGRGGSPSAARRAPLIARLDRPLRVCGMVKNEGEPGGGPFWVAGGTGGERRQIVEGAQVDPDADEQARILRSSTHFNPVHLACSLHDRTGRPYPLSRFIDPDAVIVTEKSHEGRPVRVLERPGLWNGGMAGWNTLFIEVPAEVFNPVKTIFDLLRPAHLASGREEA